MDSICRIHPFKVKRLQKKPHVHFDFDDEFGETQRKNLKLLPFEIPSLKPSEKKTKTYFLKQYFQQKQQTEARKRESAV